MAAMDYNAIKCNYTEATNVARRGAVAYVRLTNPGGGHDRIEIIIRSRGGRWVTKWESIDRLDHFRVVTLPPEHPMYDRDVGWPDDQAEVVDRDCAALQDAKARR